MNNNDQKIQTQSGAGFTLASLTIGHFLQHYLVTAILGLLPTVVASMGLGVAYFSLLHTIRYLSGGLVTCLTGFIVDKSGNQWGLILTGCMILGAILFAVLAITPSAGFLIIIAILVSIPGQVWHIPAIAAISQRFEKNRGFGLSIHGVGAQVGALTGPIATGGIILGVSLWASIGPSGIVGKIIDFLISMEPWRSVSVIYIIPTLLTAVLVWWSLKNLKSVIANDPNDEGIKSHLNNAKSLLSNPVILSLVIIVFLRNTAFNSLTEWVPFYLTTPSSEGGLGATVMAQGIGLGIVTSLGFFMAPVLGVLSDKFGRKAILVPSMALIAVLTLAIVFVGEIFVILTILGIIGLFSYTLGQILQALVLDQVDSGIAGTTLGLVLGINQLLGSVSPLIALWVSQTWGLVAVFSYTSILWALPCLILIVTPVKKAN
ncbi:MAG TPA: hypothetical protein DEZ08_06810 [Dehalococcoidia bacterium]|jgi:MFS transporter, FSR family, fosmidomycin resistance protein|nr:hypothetical protein [Dehalococcoidia bacterium]